MNTPLPTRRQRRDLTASLAGLGTQRPPRVSIANDRFTKYDANGNQVGEQALYLDVVICDVSDIAKHKLYYGRKFTGVDDSPPKCFSDNGIGPSAQSIQPQAPTCAQCWWNVTGSAISEFSGEKIKACGDRKKIAVFCMNGDELDEPALAYELVIPPASLTNLRQYRDHLATMPPAVPDRKRCGIDDVITRLTVEQGKKIGFKAIAMAAGDEDIEERFDFLTANGATDRLVGRGDMPIPAGAATAGMLVEGGGQPLGLSAPQAGGRSGPAALVAPQAPQAAPQLPFAGHAASLPDTPSTMVGNGLVTTASPSKRGRPKAQPEVLPSQAPFTPPAFLQQPAPVGQQAPFGAAPLPPAAIAEGLAKAMSLPTRKRIE